MENSPLRMSKPESKKKLFLVVGLLSCISIAIAIAFLTYDGEPQVLPTGVVSSDSSECSTLGVDILKSGGSAIDAVISATLCMGVIHPHHTGIGGGGYLMTFSRKKADKAESSVFSFVERAGSNSSAQSVVGSGVPGVLHGLNLAHQRFGKLSWKQLLSPVVKLARDGISVGESLSTSLSDESEFSDEVKDVFFIDGKPVQKGQILKQAHLAETLEIVSKFGANGKAMILDTSAGRGSTYLFKSTSKRLSRHRTGQQEVPGTSSMNGGFEQSWSYLGNNMVFSTWRCSSINKSQNPAQRVPNLLLPTHYIFMPTNIMLLQRVNP